MKSFTIFSGNDYDKAFHRWSFVYLHGKAETVFPRGEEAPDLFFCDEPMPAKGTHLCSIDGQAAIAVIAERRGLVGGRISLISDTEAMKYTLTPDDWR